MTATTPKPKRFVLSIVNPSEDIPRLIRAYGKCRGGEVALVMHPVEGRGLLFHVEATGAKRWERRGDGGDAPEQPTENITPGEAVRLTRQAQSKLGKAGPMTLRGRWRGYLHCEDGAPRVELIRKISSYGILTITSIEGRWDWRVERTEKWFSSVGDDSGEAHTLAKAIETGLATAMGLLGEACSFRDSRRRAAFDEVYAEKYPLRPAREKKDPTERFKEKAPRKKRAPRKRPTATKASTPRTKPKGSPPRAKARQPGPKARQLEPPRAQQPANSAAPDPAKDAALMAALQDTLKSLLGGA